MKDTFDPAANAAYVFLSDQPVGYTREIDDRRIVDFTAEGDVVGVEFVDASQGVSVQGLPVDESLLAYRLRRCGIPVLDYPMVAECIDVVRTTTRATRVLLPPIDAYVTAHPSPESLLIHVAGGISKAGFTAGSERASVPIVTQVSGSMI